MSRVGTATGSANSCITRARDWAEPVLSVQALKHRRPRGLESARATPRHARLAMEGAEALDTNAWFLVMMWKRSKMNMIGNNYSLCLLEVQAS